MSKKPFRFVRADLLEIDEVRHAIAGHDVVFHLAANPDARLALQDTKLDLKLETIATYNVLESMRTNGLRRIVFTSSGTVYGETPGVAVSEDYGPLLPISLYGAGKLASEALISAFCHTFDMQASIYRLANVVGGRATHGVIVDFVEGLRRNAHELVILGDGTQCKPYIHVEDCVGAMLFLFAHSREKVNVFNVGSDTATRVTDIAKMLVKEMGLEDVRFRYSGGDRGWPGDVPQVRFNVDKMNKAGWKAKYTSDQAVLKGIRDSLEGK
jgi:UDP-glucose 4-epimerase